MELYRNYNLSFAHIRETIYWTYKFLWMKFCVWLILISNINHMKWFWFILLSNIVVGKESEQMDEYSRWFQNVVKFIHLIFFFFFFYGYQIS